MPPRAAASLLQAKVLGMAVGHIATVFNGIGDAVVAGAALIGMDLPHPSNFADRGRRVLFTVVGVGIAVVVMPLANLFSKRTHAAAQQAPTGQAG